MQMAFEEFNKQNNVQEIIIQEGHKLTICGDTHGRFRDLLQIFEKNGPPAEMNIYVSLNDLIFLLKVLFFALFF